MAFTKVVGAGIHTLSNITSHNVNSSGIITATKFVGPIEGDITAVDATFTGNVSIGGTLTYEDVTNVDSVGLGTFREGIFIPDNKRIRFGNTNANPNFSIYSTPTYKQGVIDYTHSGTGRALRIRATNLQIENWNGLTPTAKFIGGVGAGHVELNYAGSKKFETTSSGVSIGGTTIITPASGGRLGIGTDNPATKLHVQGGTITIRNSTAPGVILDEMTGVGGSLKVTTASGYASFGPGNSTFCHVQTDRTGGFYFNRRVTVDEGIIGSYDEDLQFHSPLNTRRVTINKTTGHVGIGTDNPGRALTITNSEPRIRLQDSDSGGHSEIYTDNSNHLYLTADSSASAGGSRIVFQTDGANERARIDNNGNFTVYNSAAVWNTLQRATATHFIGLRIQETDGTQRMQFGVAGTSNHIVSGSAQHDVVLKSYANLLLATNQTERVRITSTGEVNVGGDYTQTSRFVNLNGGSHVGQLQLKGTEADLWLHSTGSNGQWRILGSTGNTTHAFRIYDQTNSSERLRITSDGTVHTNMTGTAPTWLGNTIACREKFSVFQGANFGEACFNIDVDNSNSFLSHNMYYSSGWKIKKSGSPVRHLEIGTNGWTFMTGADASNDSVSSLTNRFRIKPSGRVQILNNNEDIDMSSNSEGQLQIDGNGYTGAIALNDEGMFLYHNSSSRYIGIGVNETEVGRFSTAGYEQRFSNTSTYSSTTGSRKGIYVFNSGATTNCYASLELAANNSSGYFGSTILNSIATADTSYSNHFAIQLRHGGNYYERLRIESDGTIIMGDAGSITGTGVLHLYQASNDPYILIQRGVGDSAVDLGGLYFKNNTNSQAMIKAYQADVDTANLHFYVNYNNNFADRFLMESTGTFIIQGNVTDEKLVLAGSSNPYIRFRESNTNRAYVQWNSSDNALGLYNQQDGSVLRIKDGIDFSKDGSTFYNVHHSNNSSDWGENYTNTFVGTSGASTSVRDTEKVRFYKVTIYGVRNYAGGNDVRIMRAGVHTDNGIHGMWVGAMDVQIKFRPSNCGNGANYSRIVHNYHANTSSVTQGQGGGNIAKIRDYISCNESGALYVWLRGQLSYQITVNGRPATVASIDMNDYVTSMDSSIMPSGFDGEGRDALSIYYGYQGQTNAGRKLYGTSGGVEAQGNVSATGSKPFKIPHPLVGLSTTKNLVHAAIEGPQCDNIYRGKTTLVAGISTVNIDTNAGMTEGTFATLNRDVQCFTTNETGWTPIKGSVSGNQLTILAQDNSCTDTISWMVVGERQDDNIINNTMTDSQGHLIVEPDFEEITEPDNPGEFSSGSSQIDENGVDRTFVQPLSS